MSTRRILVRDLSRKWKQGPAFRTAYNVLEDEFAKAAALIADRADEQPTKSPAADQADNPSSP